MFSSTHMIYDFIESGVSIIQNLACLQSSKIINIDVVTTNY